MKKLVSLFLALVLIISVVPVSESVLAADNSGLGFSDVAGKYYADAANNLKKLNILNGKSQGANGAVFDGESKITRSEMAVIVCKLLGKSQAEINKAAKNKSKFPDVKKDHWANGYINLAAGAGIVNGDEHGFRPDDNVLYEEAVKMIVCTLGYGNNVKAGKTKWYTGYVDVAKSKGILDNVKGKAERAVKRGVVALMVNNGYDYDCDGYIYSEDLEPKEKFMPPVILLHGLTSNTDSAFGVKTNLSGKLDLYFDPEESDINKALEKTITNPDNHEITEIELIARDGSCKLGTYLDKFLLYEPNKNLYAFNYPNIDVVNHNADRLSKYINNLVSNAKNSKKFDDYKYLFPTEKARKDGQVQFILIGHSMGGLVSRYYIENIGTKYVSKLITIDTPHYGSNFATLLTATNIKLGGLTPEYSPAVADLQPTSPLFGGSSPIINISSLDAVSISKYVSDHYSRALKGNKEDVSAKYYAISGYNADGLGELTLSDSLAGKAFSFELYLKRGSKDEFRDSINKSLKKHSPESSLALTDVSGDNMVDYMSQLAIRFSDKKVEYQQLERACMVVNTNLELGILHSYINGLNEMHKFLKEFIAD